MAWRVSRAQPRLWGAEWIRARRFVLERDGYRCQVAGPACTSRATTVDHIIPRSIRPDLIYEPANLRGCCRACQHENVPNDRVIDPGRRAGW